MFASLVREKPAFSRSGATNQASSSRKGCDIPLPGRKTEDHEANEEAMNESDRLDDDGALLTIL